MHYGKPTEGICSNLKRSLANLTKQDIDQLTALVKAQLKPMQYQPGLIDASSLRPGASSHSRNRRN
jgi:hypothetical protein